MIRKIIMMMATIMTKMTTMMMTAAAMAAMATKMMTMQRRIGV